MCNCGYHRDIFQSQTKSQLRMITGKQHVIIAGKTLLLVEEDFARKCHHRKDSLVQNHDDSLHCSPGYALEIQKRKVPAAMGAIEKGKNRSGHLCPLFKQSHSGGKENLLMVVCVFVCLGVGGGVVPGEEGMREKKLLTAAQPEAQNMRRIPRHHVTSHPFSPVIILPLAEHTCRLSSSTHMHTYTTAHSLCRLDLLLSAASSSSSNIANLKQDGKIDCKFLSFHEILKILDK